MMVRVWHEPPVRQECRVSAPVEPARERLRDAFFADIGKAGSGAHVCRKQRATVRCRAWDTSWSANEVAHARQSRL
jgi:hypothetical protein